MGLNALSALILALCDLGSVTIPLGDSVGSVVKEGGRTTYIRMLQVVALSGGKGEPWGPPPASGHGVWPWGLYKSSQIRGAPLL